MLAWCHQVGIGRRKFWHQELRDSAFREQQFPSLAGNGKQGSKAAEPRSGTGLTPSAATHSPALSTAPTEPAPAQLLGTNRAPYAHKVQPHGGINRLNEFGCFQSGRDNELKASAVWEISTVRGKTCVSVEESAWPDKSCFPFQCCDGTVFPGPLMG